MVKSKKNFNLFSIFEPVVESEKRSKKTGLPPGSLVYVGPKRQKATKITIIDYDAINLEEKEIKDIEICSTYKGKISVTWINVDGIEEVDIIETIDKYFDIHPLVAEDILNTGSRPKIEDHGDYLFICFKMLMLDEKKKKVVSEHVSLLVGEDYVLTFQEKIGGDVFDVIRERIRQNKGRVRKMWTDYLAYSLLDSVVDNYFVVLENLAEKIQRLEEVIFEEEQKNISAQIHLLKRDVITLRKQVSPMREIIGALQRSESKLIKKETEPYFRDLYDHAIQVMDSIETSRDMISGLHDVHLLTISNRMNEIMKVLTIFTALFIPLNFIVGVYGMNFENMPELKWEWGYVTALLMMAVIGISMLIYFKSKKWL